MWLIPHIPPMEPALRVPVKVASCNASVCSRRRCGAPLMAEVPELRVGHEWIWSEFTGISSCHSSGRRVSSLMCSCLVYSFMSLSSQFHVDPAVHLMLCVPVVETGLTAQCAANSCRHILDLLLSLSSHCSSSCPPVSQVHSPGVFNSIVTLRTVSPAHHLTASGLYLQS